MLIQNKYSIIQKIILVLIFAVILQLSAQEKGKIEGYVKDINGSAIPRVNIVLIKTKLGAVSNDKGYFFISAETGIKYSLKFSHLGYADKYVKNIILESGETVNLGTIVLENQVTQGDFLIVTAARTEKRISEVSIPVNIISKEQILERNSKTASESLREETGIFVQKTNHGGGSAILRGLSSNQILLLIDGIRLNNSTYRLGNHQYLTTIDNNIIDKIEVIRGPSSVLYGSDALGGTINVITDRVFHQEDEKKLKIDYNFSFRNASADNEKSGRGEISLYSNKFAFKAGLSYKDFGDLKRGKKSNHPEIENSTNGYKQSPSGFSQLDYDSKLIYSPSQDKNFIFSYQVTKQKDVPRYDKYENNNYLRWIYTPQNRHFAYFLYENSPLNKFFNSVKFTASFHKQQEGREMQKNPTSNFEKEKDNVNTLGFTLNFISKLKNHELNYGTEIYFDKVSSERYITEPVTNIRTKDFQGRYIDGSTYNSYGLFIQDEISLNEKITVILGSRFSSFNTGMTIPEESDISSISGTIDENYNSMTGSFGLIYRLKNGINLNFNLGQGFRAPNLSDLSKFGESKGNIFEIPNTELKPEKILNIETGIRLNLEKLHGDFFVYQSSISELIASADAEYNGSSTIERGGETYKVKAKKNIGKAFIRGIETSASYRISSSFYSYANFTYTYGQNTTYDEPVGGIPPAFGLLGIKYLLNKYSADFFIRFASKQSRLSADDLDDSRIPDNGTPGWQTFNFRYRMNLGDHLIFQFSIENIFDTNYREHGSGINGPGRNLILSVRYKN